MKSIFLLRILLTKTLFFISVFLLANENLKLHYNFENYDETTVYDVKANSYNATLRNNACIKRLGQFHILDLNNQNGYLDLGAKVGELVSGLTDFTVATYIYIDETTDLGPNGSFMFTFSNSTDIANDPKGCIFLSARVQRYAISKTNWTGESAIETGQPLVKGVWKHISYVQAGTTGRLYVDGELIKSGTITLYPKDLGNTQHNFIGRSPYVDDVYLKNTLLTDFRIYNSALSATDVKAVAEQQLEVLKEAQGYQDLIDAKNNLVINNGKEEISQSIILPPFMRGEIELKWISSNEKYITNDGKVTRPAIGSEMAEVVLTAILTKDQLTQNKEFRLKVIPQLSNADALQKDMETLMNTWQESCIYQKIILPEKGMEGSVITWKSNNPDFVTDNGKVIKKPSKGEGNKTISLQATLSKGKEKQVRDFNLCIKENEGYTAYLFAYFIGNNGNEEAIRFALSRDGYNYRALNNNNPVIASDTISNKGGVRDPHILRGEDGYFYMVVTDMKSAQGWNSNHGIILLKSSDLINWNSSRIDIKAKYPKKFGDIQSAWAPQTIYDPDTEKYMIYWSMRSPDIHEKIYYAYANADFTDLEHEPQVLFSHPESKPTIDGDIIYKDGKYHLFFKTEGDGNGIKKAVSDKLTGDYVVQDTYLQQTDQAVEGSCVFKLINSGTYILMYDVYTNTRYEFTRSEDIEKFSKLDELEISMDFHPRHGTVIPITEEEGERLMAKWGTSNTLDILGSNSELVKNRNRIKDNTNLFLPVRYGTDLSNFDPELLLLPGVKVSPDTPQDFSLGAVAYTLSLKGNDKVFSIKAEINTNPVLDGYYADPEILYSEKTNKFYIYPTTDGLPGWASKSFKTFSSDDLITWRDEGEILILGENVKWSDRNAWAPCIIEKKISDDYYKYYYYFTASQQVGVAIANNPTGPFVDSGRPLINWKPAGITWGQEIDPDVFTDPLSGRSYIYWGNGYLAVAELNDDMVSVKENTTKVITPSDNTFREGIYVFCREGIYYFFWSEDDTGSENYKVRYGTSDNPTGPISVPSNNIVIRKDPSKQIYGTGHCSVIQLPGKDEWYVVYHRFGRPRLDPSGYRREVCLDKLEFNEDGSVKQVTPTLEGFADPSPSKVESSRYNENKLHFFPNPAKDKICIKEMKEGDLSIYNSLGGKVYGQKIFSEEQVIDVGHLSAGVYVLLVMDKGDNEFHGILIKR